MEDLGVISRVDSLRKILDQAAINKKIALVPTMGALHSGHMTLVQKAFSMADVVVVSIFVNPKQFNNKEDLEKYPRSLESDVEMLRKEGDVIIFAPTVDEIYPENFKEIDLDLGFLEETMEGEFRPGHFKGVVNVCHRLIELSHCDYALFGLKDFQQLAVIQFMKDQLNMKVEIIPCEIAREPSGLASSSRNRRLSETDKEKAVIIYNTMNMAKSLVLKQTPDSVKNEAVLYFSDSDLELEYLEIVDPDTLHALTSWVPGARICIAAYCNGVRLIDNMELIER